MRFPQLKLDRAFLLGIAQAFDLSGSIESPRLREIRNRTPEQALARDWANVTRDWDRVARRCATAHAE